MKIRESKRPIREEKEDAQLKISGVRGKRGDRVAMFRDKDTNDRHGVYRTRNGVYYNRYFVRDMYGDGDELVNKGVAGPFMTEKEAKDRMKDYKPNVVEEGLRRNRRAFREDYCPYKEGDVIEIISMDDPQGYRYEGRKGTIRRVAKDPWGDIALYGDWGGLAVYPHVDKVRVIKGR